MQQALCARRVAVSTFGCLAAQHSSLHTKALSTSFTLCQAYVSSILVKVIVRARMHHGVSTG